ncbi:hypothetical protein ES703_87702 [subsurface metagenome]
MGAELFIEEVTKLFLKPNQTYKVEIEPRKSIKVIIDDGREITAYEDRESSPFKWLTSYNWALDPIEIARIYEFERESFTWRHRIEN